MNSVRQTVCVHAVKQNTFHTHGLVAFAASVLSFTAVGSATVWELKGVT